MNDLENRLGKNVTTNQESNRENAPAQDSYVLSKESIEIIKEGYRIIGDPKVPYQNDGLRYSLNRAANELSRFRNVSRKRINQITQQLEYYKLIVEVNSKLDNNFRIKMLKVLNEVHDVLIANSKRFVGKFAGDRWSIKSVPGYITGINHSIRELKEGKYITNNGLYTAGYVIEKLDKSGIDTSNLKNRLSKIKERFTQAGGMLE